LVRRGTVRGVIDLNFFDTIVRLLHTGRPAHFYFTYSPLSLFVLEVWSCDPPKRWAFELSPSRSDSIQLQLCLKHEKLHRRSESKRLKPQEFLLRVGLLESKIGENWERTWNWRLPRCFFMMHGDSRLIFWFTLLLLGLSFI
jgi:hypothetical protein